MPIIEMHLLEGRTPEQKSRAAKAVTDAVTEALGVDPQTVRILITEHRTDEFYVAGMNPQQRREAAAAAQNNAAQNNAAQNNAAQSGAGQNGARIQEKSA